MSGGTTRLLTSILAAMGLLGGLASCASPGGPPVDVAAAYVILVCGFNCPLNTTVADEGTATDAVPNEQTHMLADNIRAVNERYAVGK